jgi:crotonobetainyl-CoA:carnitine CoA-transferase CaiB-like acyl-CoA transferase
MNGISAYYLAINRNKRSITCDLKTQEGKEILERLIERGDVVVENFSLGVLERWGLGYERLRELKPDIILISLKGLGNSGPYAHHVTWGPNLMCLLGMTYLWNHADATFPTAEARTQHPDFMSGVAGAAAVMAALLARERTGRGTYIDGAQIEAGASLLGPTYLDYIVNGRDPKPVGNGKAGAAPYGAYPCADDDRWCVIAVESQTDWERFSHAIGDPDWCRDDRFATPLARERNLAELDRRVSEWTCGHTGQEVMDILQAAGVAAAPVQDVEDQLQRDRQAQARGLYVELNEPEMGPLLTEYPPTRLSETPAQVYAPAPLMGEHTEQVMREVLHLNESQIAQLAADGVLD